MRRKSISKERIWDRLDLPERVVCAACGAGLEVVVSFKGNIVWTIDPDYPDFSGQQPSLRGETGSIRVICSADILHDCGYECIDGALVNSKKRHSRKSGRDSQG